MNDHTSQIFSSSLFIHSLVYLFFLHSVKAFIHWSIPAELSRVCGPLGSLLDGEGGVTYHEICSPSTKDDNAKAEPFCSGQSTSIASSAGLGFTTIFLPFTLGLPTQTFTFHFNNIALRALLKMFAKSMHTYTLATIKDLLSQGENQNNEKEHCQWIHLDDLECVSKSVRGLILCFLEVLPLLMLCIK